MELDHFAALLHPEKLHTREEILARDCPVPREPGIYAWYFDQPPAGVPTEGCHQWQGMSLLYVGISPKQPPANGKQPSRQRLWNRVRYHYRGNAYGSTLRLSLGCLLADELRIRLQRVGSGNRLTFAAGERVLDEWMNQHARVAWMPHSEPWLAEECLIRTLDLPLNLDHNKGHFFHETLSARRASAREAARRGPLANGT